jgi:hypothetical protein
MSKAKVFLDKRDCVVAGMDQSGVFEVEFQPCDLNEQNREELLFCEMDENEIFDLSQFDGQPLRTGALFPSILAVNLALDCRKARRITQQMMDEHWEKLRLKLINANTDIIKKWMDNPETWPCSGGPFLLGDDLISDKLEDFFSTVSGLSEACEDYKSLMFWQELDTIAGTVKATRLAQELQAENKAILQRRIKAWVKQYGTESQQERFKAGVLPEQEAIVGLTKQIMEPLEVELNLKPVIVPAACSACHHEGIINIKYIDRIDPTMTESEFDLVKKIKSVFPKATITICDVHSTCSNCHISQASIAAKVDVFTRKVLYRQYFEMPKS